MEHQNTFPTLINETLALDLISKLTFVSTVKVGEKIDVSSLTIVSASWFPSNVYRRAVGENRNDLYDFLSGLVMRGFELAKAYLLQTDEYHKVIGNKIIEALLKSNSGLKNLIKTYELDRLFAAKLITLGDLIKTKSADINRYFSTHK